MKIDNKDMLAHSDAVNATGSKNYLQVILLIRVLEEPSETRLLRVMLFLSLNMENGF